MPPAYAQRPKPLGPLELDRRMVAEVARVLADRRGNLDAVLARLRRLLDAIDRDELTRGTCVTVPHP